MAKPICVLYQEYFKDKNKDISFLFRQWKDAVFVVNSELVILSVFLCARFTFLQLEKLFWCRFQMLDELYQKKNTTLNKQTDKQNTWINK